MIAFFDFLFYKIYKAYSKTSESSPEFAGSCAVSGFQAFNILSIIWICEYLIRKELNISKLFAGTLIASLIILNYIRYIRISRFSKETIEAKWENKSLNDQKKYRSILISYLIISTVLFFGLVFYSASKKM